MADTELIIGFAFFSLVMIGGMIFAVNYINGMMDNIIVDSVGSYYGDKKVLESTTPDIITEQEPEEKSNVQLIFNNDRIPSLQFVSATEYTKGDGTGQTIIKLSDWKGNKINTTCYEEILYPNKSIYISWTEMTQHWEYGNYYMNFPVPEPIGIYDQEVRCEVSNKNISLGKGFHVSNLTNVIETQFDTIRPPIMTVTS